MGDIYQMVEEAISHAELHAKAASQLLEGSGLEAALDYCCQQGIDPPQCSLTAQSANADNQRSKAKRMLTEVKWWTRRLELKAAREFELIQIQQGNVQNVISDEGLEYHQNRKKRNKFR